MSVLVHVVKANLQERAITISHWNFTQYSGRKYHVFNIHYTDADDVDDDPSWHNLTSINIEYILLIIESIPFSSRL